jgi:hypothetical protein
MSTDYCPLSVIIASHLLDGHLDMFNIHELRSFSRYAGSYATEMIRCISCAFWCSDRL